MISGTPNAAEIDEATIKAILHDFKIHNADVILKKTSGVDRFVDALIPGRLFVPAITVVNKIDQSSESPTFGDVHISAEHGINIEGLKRPDL